MGDVDVKKDGAPEEHKERAIQYFEFYIANTLPVQILLHLQRSRAHFRY